MNKILKSITLQAYLTGFSSRADGGASVRFTTQELTGDDFLSLKDYHNSFGHLLFSPNPFTESDIPKEMAVDKNKTPSKRLRNVLYVKWEQSNRPLGSFETYYNQYMEKWINHIKDSLD